MFVESEEHSLAENSAKEKIACHLPVEIIESLEEIIFHAKKRIARRRARQLTKSKIVEIVLAAAITEHDKKSGHGVISDLILNWAESED